MSHPRRASTSPLVLVAAVATITYATVAGFHTLSDFDLWWQIAAGRWMLEQGQVLRQEVFSYTASGTPWIYPAGSALLFQWIIRLGGLASLSLLAPAACLIVALLVIRPGGLLRAWMLALAAPVIAWRAAVRADLFTTLLSAVFLVVLWEAHQRWSSSGSRESKPSKYVWIWILPLLMLAWVNLHPGFILGVALILAFTVRHPQRLWPCLTASLLATLANPWGWRVYQALADQGRALEYQKAFIGEWAGTRVSTAVLLDALNLRDPDSSFWWLMAMVIAAAFAGIVRRRPWGALLLIAAAGSALSYSRFQAWFAVCAAIVAPDLLAPNSRQEARAGNDWRVPAFAVLLLLFAAVRIFDLATNRHYITHGDIASFGTGVSTWYPERATKFVESHGLPRELYNDYNLGGFLTWRLTGKYPVFIDGRALPYGPELFFLQRRLGGQAPDTPDWRDALERWKIRTLIVSVSRYGGFGGLPLKNFCDSPAFRLAYLDETAAVFVRTEDLRTPALDCRTASLTAPADSAPLWDRYQFFANAGKLYYALERDNEAEKAWTQARALFEDDPSLHLDLGQLRHAQGNIAEAEREFRRAIALRPTPTSWFALGDLLAQQGRHFEALECFRESALREPRPHEAWAAMGRSALAAQRPQEALDAANRALDANPYQGPAAVAGRGFTTRALVLRASAFQALGQPQPALESLDQAKKLGARGPTVDRLEKELGAARK